MIRVFSQGAQSAAVASGLRASFASEAAIAAWTVCLSFVLAAMLTRLWELRAKQGSTGARGLAEMVKRLRAKEGSKPSPAKGKPKEAAEAKADTDVAATPLVGQVITLSSGCEGPVETFPKELTIWPAIVHGACSVLFTSIMPVASEVVVLAGKDAAWAGHLVGAYGIGAVISVPVFWHFRCRHVKTSCLVHTILVICGAAVHVAALLLHVEGDKLVYALVFARFLYGISAGANYTGSLALTSATPSSRRTEFISYWAAGGSAGMLIGPAMASASEAVVIAVLGTGCSDRAKYAAQGFVILSYGITALIFMARTFAADSVLAGHCKYGDSAVSAEVKKSPKQQCELRTARSALGLFLTFSGVVLRTSVRVSWEVAAFFILKMSFGISRVNSGFVAAGIVSVYILLQFSFGAMLRKGKQLGWELRDHNLVLSFEFCGLVGLGVLALPGLASFLVGSAVLFSANALSGSPMLSFCTKMGAGPGAWLSTGNLLLVNQLSALTMYWVAPLYSAHMLSHMPDVLALVGILLPILVCKLLVMEVCMHGVETPEEVKKLPAPAKS